jgi:hypothetical protein
MKHDDVEALIDQLNFGGPQKLIFISTLSDSVDFAKVWSEEPKGKGCENSYNFYFVRVKGIYVGAVFDMGDDLHVFVKPEYRGQGHLSSAMHQTVFPHLYQKGRRLQFLTFEDPKVGQYLEKCWGCEINSYRTASKSLSVYDSLPLIESSKRDLTKGEFDLVATYLDRARLYVLMAAEQLECVRGEGCDEGLREFASDVSYVREDVIDSIITAQKASFI